MNWNSYSNKKTNNETVFLFPLASDLKQKQIDYNREAAEKELETFIIEIRNLLNTNFADLCAGKFVECDSSLYEHNNEIVIRELNKCGYRVEVIKSDVDDAFRIYIK